MRSCILLLCLYFNANFADRAQAQSPTSIVLAIGSSKILKLRGEVHFSNNNILKASDLGSAIRIVGKHIGEVEVDSKSGAFHVEVLKTEEFSLYTQLVPILRELRGLQIEIHKGQIRIVGNLLRKGDWLKLAKHNYDGSNFRFHASLTDSTKSEMLTYFQNLLRSSDLPVTSLQVAPFASISLNKNTYLLHSSYERVLSKFGFVIEKNASTLQLEPLVRVNILVAEIRKNLSRSLGIAFPGSATASLLPSFQMPAAGESVNAQINALESQGKGHLLAAPTLLCRSGKNAEFLAGGEIPIKMMNLKYHETTWKKYGVLLKVSPLADHTGRMSIALTTEVSMLDSSHSIEGVPALLTNRIESHFDLKKSRTIALSGLMKNEWFKNSEGLPWLSQIPILGYLFSSKEYKNNETELVIFVTPEVIQPESLTEEES